MAESHLKLSVLAAYRRLLKPLVRILIRNNVSFGEFSELAKDVYVEVAAADFEPGGQQQSQGRIAILTGLTQKEVNRLINERGKQQHDQASNLDQVTRILSGWHTDPLFTGPYGLPLDVPYDAASGRSFCELVRRYTADTSAQVMLDELLRIGVVTEAEGARYKVLTRTYLPTADAPESLDRLGFAVSNFVETMDFNRTETDAHNKLFERTVVADTGLTTDDLPLFKAHVRERGQFLLEELDDWLSKREHSGDGPTVSTGVGIYHYIRASDD